MIIYTRDVSMFIISSCKWYIFHIFFYSDIVWKVFTNTQYGLMFL